MFVVGLTIFCSPDQLWVCKRGYLWEQRTRWLVFRYILDLLKIVFVVTQYSLTMIRNNTTVCAAAAIEQTEIVDVGAACSGLVVGFRKAKTSLSIQVTYLLMMKISKEKWPKVRKQWQKCVTLYDFFYGSIRLFYCFPSCVLSSTLSFHSLSGQRSNKRAIYKWCHPFFKIFDSSLPLVTHLTK